MSSLCCKHYIFLIPAGFPSPRGGSHLSDPGAVVGQNGMQSPYSVARGITGALGRALLGPEVQLSGKHNGLCRYLARLLW